MYRIEDFVLLNKLENIVITQHCRKRLAERGLSIKDVCSVIDSGEIIEQYPADHPFPSCLILGKTSDKVVHIVLSMDSGFIYLITAYIPTSDKWMDDWKTRKETES